MMMCALLPRILRFRSALKPPMTLMAPESAERPERDREDREHADEREKPALLRAHVARRDVRREGLALEPVEDPRQEREHGPQQKEDAGERSPPDRTSVSRSGARRAAEHDEVGRAEHQRDERRRRRTLPSRGGCRGPASPRPKIDSSPRQTKNAMAATTAARRAGPPAGKRPSCACHFPASGLSRGKRMTSRMDAEWVSAMTSRSIPIPKPAAGGIPCSRARM